MYLQRLYEEISDGVTDDEKSDDINDVCRGCLCVVWLRENGANVTAVGIGHRPDGTWDKAKFYANGVRDTALYCDWDKEHAWWEKQKNVTLL